MILEYEELSKKKLFRLGFLLKRSAACETGPGAERASEVDLAKGNILSELGKLCERQVNLGH